MSKERPLPIRVGPDSRRGRQLPASRSLLPRLWLSLRAHSNDDKDAEYLVRLMQVLPAIGNSET